MCDGSAVRRGVGEVGRDGAGFVCVGLEPSIGQQLRDRAVPRLGQSAEHVAQVLVRIGATALGALDQRVDHRGASAALVRPAEQVILAVDMTRTPRSRLRIG